MELSFVINATKRYWWIVAALALLGLLGGTQMTPPAGDQYSSKSVLLVSAPSDSLSGGFREGAERYIQGQLSVIQSANLAQQVADSVGEGLTGPAVSANVAITPIIGTDIIEIVATFPDPEVAEAVAADYVTQYLVNVQQLIDAAQKPREQALQNHLIDVRQRLQDVDTKIQETMAPYIAAGGAVIPTIDQVDPQLATDREQLSAELDRAAVAADQMVLGSQLKVTSKVVQSASPAELVPIGSTTKILLAGMVTGAMVGVVVASALASISKRTLDEHHIAAALGVDVVGEFPRSRALTKNRRAAAEALPNRLAAFVDLLDVRAEANARIGEAFTVVVVGTERASGTTTLAAAMANRFAVNGSQVLLVDADPRDSELTRLFAAGAPGIPALLAGATSNGGARRPVGGGRLDPLSHTALAGLSVVGIGDKSASTALRRQNVPDLIEAASSRAHVVVFDGGPLLDAASTVQLANLVDAVVLAIPMRKMLTRSLVTLGAQVQDRRGELLPVLMPAARRRVGRSPKRPTAVPDRPFGLAGQPDVEQIPVAEPTLVGRN
jgi:Mrp family chromosome partitioning ATPase